MSNMQAFHKQLQSPKCERDVYARALTRLTQAKPSQVRDAKLEAIWNLWTTEGA